MLNKMLECCTVNQIDLSLAYLNYNTFLDLMEIQKYWDVGWGSSQQVIYCTARTSADVQHRSPSCHEEGVNYFVPIAGGNPVSISQIKHIQSVLNQQSVTLAVQSAGGSIVYYSVRSGMSRAEDKNLQGRSHLPSRTPHNIKQLLTQATANSITKR